MLSRKYLQSHLQLTSCVVTFTLLTSLCIVRTFAVEHDAVLLTSPLRQIENNSSGKHSQGSNTAIKTEAADDVSTEGTTVPNLPDTFSSSETSASLSNAKKPTVTVLPSSLSRAPVVVTATQVHFDHRMLSVDHGNDGETEGSTETPVQDETSTEAPAEKNENEESHSGKHEETHAGQSERQSRYHRYHDENDHAEPAESEEPKTEESNYESHMIDNKEAQEPSTEYYKEPEIDGGDSYSDFLEDNELLGEQLPTPMALITPNGEGNNPPLEDDFAEAFKKVNGKGKRRRFRGGRRGRMKIKKVPDANDSSTSSSMVSEHEESSTLPGSKTDQSSLHSTTTSPKFKRYRSTTPAPQVVRVQASTISTMAESPNDNEAGGNAPIIRHGPKPMILQHSNNNHNDNDVSSHTVVTAVPHVDKPGNGGHTEKISTYFFSTPSPSSRIRLRQKIRESLPSTEPPMSSTTTESSVDSILREFPSENDEMANVWKNEFSEFPPNPFFSDTSSSSSTFKIPDFVPMNIGLETDDHQDPPVENALPRPDPAENKVYSTSNYPHQTHSAEVSSHDGYEAPYSSTTPKSHKVRRPSRVRGSPPTSSPEKEKHPVTEYYSPGPDSESSSSYSSQRPASGSHYDRTKDHVVFYNDSPYSTQHSPIAALNGRDFTPSALDTTPETTSKTVGSHLSVTDSGLGFYDRPGPLSASMTVDHHYDPNLVQDHSPPEMYTRGHVYPSDAMNSQIESTFLQNGPPDSSHIHSPNIVEHAHALPPPEVLGHEPHDLQSLHHHHAAPHPGAQHHDAGALSEQTHLEEAHAHHHHPPMGRPGVGDALYGTVEEVPAHGNTLHFDERHNPQYPHHHPHMHPPPPGAGSAPYHFGAGPHPLHSPAMPFHIPPPHHGEHTLDTHPFPPHPLPQPPPSSQFHSHENDDIHNSIAPGFHMNAPDFDPNHFNIHHGSDHLAGSPPEMRHPHGMSTPPHHGSMPPPDGHASGTSSSPTSQSLPEYPSTSNSDGRSPSDSGASEPVSIFSSGAAPPPQPPPHMDQSFSPHSHTMASHADYEPANPPLPHDHPFHQNFFSFPSQDMHEHHITDTNSISGGSPSVSDGSYHPGIVESVPTGRPPSFEPSALIPEKFTPIPDDVKETDLYATFANKPFEGEQLPHEQSRPDGSESPVSSNQISDIHHPNEPPSMYHGPPDGDESSSFHSHLPQQHIPPREVSGYSGPVNEIHAGPYHPVLSHGPSPHNAGPPTYHDHPSHDPHSGYHSVSSHDFQTHGGPLSGPPFSDIDLSPHHGPPSSDHDITEDNEYLPHSPIKGGSGKKEKKKPQASFSNTPYVLMFPQLIPEEKMRPSPPPVLTKEIPVIQASSLMDYESADKPPMAPGFKAVPVHPRHQMYQVLAKTHYEKMMERYKESKKKPPSAIYTPYGILVPVGTNVDAGAASVSHNVFAKPRAPPKFRGEKNLLTTLLGSSSSMQGRFQPPGMNNRVNKLFEYQPAIDALAEKLAMKIVHAQQTMSNKKGTAAPEIEKKKDGNSEEDKPAQNKTEIATGKEEDHAAMASEVKETLTSPDMKDYLKGVLKGQLTEMVETSVSAEDTRRPPVTLSTKLLNSFFRKGRISSMTKLPSIPGPPPPPPPMMMQASGSMMMPNKVHPPPGMLTQPLYPHHGPGGVPYPHPPPQGPISLLGQIRRLFSFAPPEGRYEVGIAPNFAAGRTLYTNNGTGMSYVDGPSPRSSHFAPQIILPHPNMVHQQHPPAQQMQSRVSTGHEPLTSAVFSPSHTITTNGGTSSNTNAVTPTPKPPKKKKKPSSPPTKKPLETPTQSSKWPQTSKLPTLSTSSEPNKRLEGTSQTTAVTAKPNIPVQSTKVFNSYNRTPNNTNAIHSNIVTKHIIMTTNNNHNHTSKSAQLKTAPSIGTYVYPNGKIGPKTKPEITSAAKGEIIMNKRISIAPSSSIGSDSKDTFNQSSKPPKLDMFQTILGSTRSVLNFFKSSEARKSSGFAPILLKSPNGALGTVAPLTVTTPQLNKTLSDSR